MINRQIQIIGQIDFKKEEKKLGRLKLKFVLKFSRFLTFSDKILKYVVQVKKQEIQKFTNIEVYITIHLKFYNVFI